MTTFYSSIRPIDNHSSINSKYISQPAKFDGIIEYTDQHVNFDSIRAKIKPEHEKDFANLVNCLVVVSEFSSTSKYFVALEKQHDYAIDKDKLLNFLMKSNDSFTEDDVKVILEACTGGIKANIYPALDIKPDKHKLIEINSILFAKGPIPDNTDESILNTINDLFNLGNFIFSAGDAEVFINSISADSEFDKSQSVAPIKSIEVQKPLKNSDEEKLLSQSLMKLRFAQPKFQITTEEKKGTYIISFKASSSNSLTIFKPSLICIKHSLEILNENLRRPDCQIEKLDLRSTAFDKSQTDSLLEAINQNTSLWVIRPITTKFIGPNPEERDKIFKVSTGYLNEVENRNKTFRKDFKLEPSFTVSGENNEIHLVIIKFEPKQPETKKNLFFDNLREFFE